MDTFHGYPPRIPFMDTLPDQVIISLFSSRPFEEFLFQYRFINLSVVNDKSLDPKEKTKCLLRSAKIDSGWQVGQTMIFMKPAAMKEMAKRQRECLAAWTPLVELLEVHKFTCIFREYYFRGRPWQ